MEQAAVQTIKRSSKKGALSGVRKAAILLIYLGEKLSAEVFRELHNEEVKIIGHEISNLGYVDDEISEVVELDGRTQVETDAEFLRVFGVQVLSAGSDATAAGTIYVGTGALDGNFKPAVVYSKAALGDNASVNGFYTVPAGHAAYLTYGSIATGSAVNNKYVTGRLIGRPYGGVFYTAAIVTLLNQQADFPFGYPIRFPEKTDIEARAVATGDTFEVSTHFEIVLVKGETAPAYTVPRY